MRRAVGTFGLLFAVVLTLGACGGGGGGEQKDPPAREESTTETASSQRSLPEQGPLSAGKYRTEKFEPAFSFEVGEGWEVAGPEFQEALGIARGGDSFLFFSNPRQVFDPKKPGDRKEVPAPETSDEWVAWYQENPHLEITKPEPVTLSSVSGVRFDLTVASAPKNYPKGCGAPCVPAYPVGSTEIDFFLGDLGDREEDFVLEVGGETVTVSISAPADKLEEFRSEAQKILDTVEWEAES